MVSQRMQDLITQGRPASALRTMAMEEGMVEFRHSALLKVAQGETSIEEVVRVLPTEYFD